MNISSTWAVCFISSLSAQHILQFFTCSRCSKQTWIKIYWPSAIAWAPSLSAEGRGGPKTHVPARMEPGEGGQTRQVFILKHTHKHTKKYTLRKSREHNEQTAVIRQTRNRQTKLLRYGCQGRYIGENNFSLRHEWREGAGAETQRFSTPSGGPAGTKTLGWSSMCSRPWGVWRHCSCSAGGVSRWVYSKGNVKPLMEFKKRRDMISLMLSEKHSGLRGERIKKLEDHYCNGWGGSG